MDTKKIFHLFYGVIVITLILVLCTPAAAHTKAPNSPPGRSQFVTVLQTGVWQKEVLGSSSKEGGYVVDISPLAKTANGVHIERKILPEFDGKQWNDVLWLLMPEESHPLAVRVNVYCTAGWPVIWQTDLLLTEEWNGYVIRDSDERGAYVIEINPYEPGLPGTAVDKAIIQPEFPWGAWLDVLRIQLPAGQAPMWANVVIYSQPDLQVFSEIETTVSPGDWQGHILGPSKLKLAYLVEIDPAINEGIWLERYTIQPEFDGRQWNDVLRLYVAEVDPPYPPLPLIARIYIVQ